MKSMNKLLASSLISLNLAGCSLFGGGESGDDVAPVTGPGGDATAAQTQGVDNSDSFSGVETQATDGNYTSNSAPNAGNVPQDLLSQRVIYFEYDSSEVSAEGQAIIQAHARYLAQNTNARIELQGHADERGSREYNIALGEQRALSVARLMKLQGSADNQLDSVSFGEEKPVALGNDNAAWSQNRRVELVYPGY